MAGVEGAKTHEMTSHTHMTFYWGKDSEILFAGWPGTSAGMYALAAALVFFLAGAIEWLGHRGAGAGCHTPRAVAAHTLRVALAYVVMLAVMSFNVGILVAAVTGHALGYIWFFAPPATEASKDAS
ncbi:hypothetical protein HPP92_001548 [Vanilla planifolia]|uniref:Copper transport protein n=1 Tax=Vanilla planifolia TaxID=51239 RepID=A0A835VLY0_VANPL|nr:hypothetical protein HPP92_001548 [Vanilla planifolia]